MAVEHLVWFKLKEGVTQDEKDAMFNALRALPSTIDGIEHLAVGDDFSGRSRGFQVGLVVRFVSREALEVYGPHPAHAAFADGFKHLWDDVQALDFETT
jgi:hypothetical protein